MPASSPEPSVLDLPKPPGRLRQWMATHPHHVDIIVTAMFAAFTALSASLTLIVAAQELPPVDVWSALLVVATGAVAIVCVYFRRRFPLTGTFISAMLPPLVVLGRTDFAGYTPFLAEFVLIYTAGSVLVGRRAWFAYGISVVGVIFWHVTLSAFFGTGAEHSVSSVMAALMLLVMFLSGRASGNRRRYTEALIQRAHDLARERDQRGQLAVSTERTRIAREMHDVVSHSLTVMVTLSEGAAASAEAGAPDAPRAMRLVAETGRESLTEMRRLLGVLRSPSADADLAPQPGDTDIDVLVERMRDAGLDVTYRREGPPITDRAIAVSSYRIVQEGLTNVLRHAAGADHVCASIRTSVDGAVWIDIDNSRGTVQHDPVATGRGTGLIGLRERAALHGGTLESGPTPGGGWSLHATLKPSHPIHGESALTA